LSFSFYYYFIFYIFVLVITGSVGGILVKHHGCRKVAILGSIIATVGLATSMFVPSMYFPLFDLEVKGQGLTKVITVRDTPPYGPAHTNYLPMNSFVGFI
jgi:hypothetical protein